MKKDVKIYSVKGFGFSKEETEKAWDNNRPLNLGLTFPARICNANCPYCYTFDYKAKEGTKPLSIKEIYTLLKEARDMGCKTISIPGYGEPLMNKEFWPILNKAKELGLYLMVFSNGTLITKKVAQKLKKYPISFMIKLNSLDEKKQDMLMGKNGLAMNLYQGLDNLIEAGFNRPDENGMVRLAIHAGICKATKKDVMEVVDWAIQRNIYPFLEKLFPSGSAIKPKNIKLLGKDYEIELIYNKIKKQISEKYPQRKQDIFGEGPCNLETVSVIVEAFSGTGTQCFTRRTIDIGNYEKGDNLEKIWANNFRERRERISIIDSRSPKYNPCHETFICAGRCEACKKNKK